MNQVVAHFADGHIVKGTTSDFSPGKASFHIREVATPPGSPPGTISTECLKALFFVKDLAGDCHRVDRIDIVGPVSVDAHAIEVEFADGEVLVGTTFGYRPERTGFFVEPADPESNIERAYIVSTAARKIAFARSA